MADLSRPLAGKVIVVTRAPEQSAGLAHALTSLGAEVLSMPTVAFAHPEDPGALDDALAHISRFDWVVFTSQNAIRFLAERADELGRGSEWLSQSPARIAVIGHATQEAAEHRGIAVDYIAQEQTGELLARELAAELHGKSVLLPRSDKADDRLPAALRAHGAHVTEVVAYRTAAPRNFDAAILQRVCDARVAVIVFASPSAFHNFVNAVGDCDVTRLSSRIQFAVIGPTTARALRESGARVAIEAHEASAGALAGAIAKYFQRETELARR